MPQRGIANYCIFTMARGGVNWWTAALGRVAERSSYLFVRPLRSLLGVDVRTAMHGHHVHRLARVGH
jgi:hypothetical protein